MLFDFNEFAKLLNDNQGVLSIAIFAVTAIYGWISGTFAALRRKPNFKIKTIEGPTFLCTFGIGLKHKGWDVHRTAIALYLSITNTGSSAADIDALHIGYKWSIKPFGVLWWKYRVGWFWLSHQSISISDFQTKIGDSTKFFPFLTQKSAVSGESANTYLEIGQSTRGVVYFEQDDSFGGCFPHCYKHRVRLKIRLIDSFGRAYVHKFYVDRVSLEEAWRFNPSFGFTYTSLREGNKPFDLPTDRNGNLLANSEQPHS